MNLKLTDAELNFREEVRQFIAENLTAQIRRDYLASTGVFSEKEVALAWQEKLVKKGWAAPLWPEKYGGVNWTQTQKYIFEVESAKAGAPMLIPLGLKMCAPVIIKFGTEQQKQHFLPRMLSGEDYWCQGYSEPGAGSDLASLSCKAQLENNQYRVNGSKIWTTHAHYANWIFCLVRTNSEVKPQAGISFLLIPMDSPGITVRPIISISGQHDLNEVHFDNVMVPVENRVGEEGQGWTCAKYLLTLERGAAAWAARLRASFLRIQTLAATELNDEGLALIHEPNIHCELIKLDAAITALEYTELRVQKLISLNQDSGAEPSLLKADATEIEQQLANLAMRLAGPSAQILIREFEDAQWPEPNAADSHWGVPRYLNSRAASIYAGSNEIQRNIIANTLLNR
jgi:acyl-CoA dehydrogenase